MNNEINYREWKVPELSEGERHSILRKIRNAPEKKNVYLRLAPAFATFVMVILIVAGIFYYKANSLESNLRVVNKMLEEDMARHKKYIYFADSISHDWSEREVPHETFYNY